MKTILLIPQILLWTLQLLLVQSCTCPAWCGVDSAILGTWGGEIQLENGTVLDGQYFTFHQTRFSPILPVLRLTPVTWHDGYWYPDAEYTIDGSTVVIDDFLSQGDIFAGELVTTLTLSEDGNTLTGLIAFDSDLCTWEYEIEKPYDLPCRGTIELHRVDKLETGVAGKPPK